MKAYLYWYKFSEYDRTEYLYIIAVSKKQANYLFYANGYKNMYDYSNGPIDIIDACHFRARHNVGDILGQNAIIWANTQK